MLTRSYGAKAWVFILVLSLVMITGCAKPPTQEVTQAEKAIGEAKHKEADIYVKDIFTKAEHTLKKAKDLMSS